MFSKYFPLFMKKSCLASLPKTTTYYWRYYSLGERVLINESRKYSSFPYHTQKQEYLNIKPFKVNLLYKQQPIRTLHFSCRKHPIRLFSSNDEFQEFEIDCEQFTKEMNNGDKYIIDVRTVDEINELGKIPGSVNIPVDEVEYALQISDDVFGDLYGATKPDVPDGENFIFYCRSGVRSLNAMTTARRLGYEKAKHLIGGYTAWMEYQQTEKDDD